MPITMVVFEGLVEFQVTRALWVPDPEDYLEVTFQNGNILLLWREEGGVSWEVLGCCATITNWSINVPMLFGEVSGTPIPHEVLEDFLFSPDESLDVEMGPELPQAQPLALENGVSEEEGVPGPPPINMEELERARRRLDF